jgi:hypothetical protein
MPPFLFALVAGLTYPATKGIDRPDAEPPSTRKGHPFDERSLAFSEIRVPPQPLESTDLTRDGDLRRQSFH